MECAWVYRFSDRIKVLFDNRIHQSWCQTTGNLILWCGFSGVFVRQALSLPVEVRRAYVQPCFLGINLGCVHVEVPVYNLLDTVGELEFAGEPGLRRF